MYHVRQHVSAEDTAVADAKRVCCLHVAQLADFQCFRAYQAAQGRPAGDAQNEAECDELGVSLFHANGKEVGVQVDVYLEQQHGRSNEQNARNGAQGGV